MTDTNLPDEFWDNAKVRTPDKPVTFTVNMTAEHLRLYSAAPDLLEALEEIDRWSRRANIAMPSPKIYAAIAKAKGEAK